MIITISGNPGSGKSTIAKMLSDSLGIKRYSTGDFRRNMAKEMKLSLAEFNKLGETNDFTDKKADEWQANLGKNEDNFIIDARLGFHFIPNSLKIFLDVHPEIGAERIMNENRAEEPMKNKEQAVGLWKERIKSDRKRYRQYYNLDISKKSNYDLWLDTSNLAKQEVMAKILEFINFKKP